MRSELIKKTISAFESYKEGYDLTWAQVADMANIPFGSIRRVLGLTENSTFQKGEAVHWNKKDEQELFDLIKSILKENGHKLFLNEDGSPLFNDDESFKFEDMETGRSPTSLDLAFKIYYWSQKHKVNEGKLTLNDRKASLTLTSELAELRLTGSYSEHDKTFFIQLTDSSNANKHPVSQVVFRTVSDFKEFYIGVFSTANWQRNYPVSGMIVLENLLKPNNFPEKDALIKYLLVNKRFNIEPGEFNINEICMDDPHIPLYPRQWDSIRKVWGSYEGFFINPSLYRFENCLLTIYKSGEIRMWVSSDFERPYTGMVKTYQDALIICCDYEIDMDDYKTRILIDVEGYTNEIFSDNNKTYYYGINTGFPRNSSYPGISRFAFRRIRANPIDKDEYLNDGGKIYSIGLTKPNGMQDFDARLRELELSDFFYGQQESQLSSLGLLINSKNT